MLRLRSTMVAPFLLSHPSRDSWHQIPGGLRPRPLLATRGGYWGRRQKEKERGALKASRSREGGLHRNPSELCRGSRGTLRAQSRQPRFCHFQPSDLGLQDFLKPSLLFWEMGWPRLSVLGRGARGERLRPHRAEGPFWLSPPT